MKCPKCGINLLEHVGVCPFCKTKVSNESEAPVSAEAESTNTGRFSAIDPAKDSYDFDLQYTLTFRDSGEIKQAIADMNSEMSNSSGRKASSEKKEPSAPRYTLEEMQEAALRAQQRREREKRARRHPMSARNACHTLKSVSRMHCVRQSP